MTFGRPHAIPEDHVRLSLPTPVDGEMFVADDTQNLKATSVLFFVDTMYAVQIFAHSTILTAGAASSTRCSTK